MKLISVEEMGYRVSDMPPRGELCVRGKFVFSGYFKSTEQTRQALTNDGWYLTGDVATIKNNRVTLIDRKKNIFKLAQGEYVAPEKLEEIYGRSRYVSQILVHGEPTEPWLVAIVVPDPEAAIRLARERNIPGMELDASQFLGIDYVPNQGLADLLSSAAVKETIMDDLTRLAAAKALPKYEYIKAVHIESMPFSVDNGLLTPTLKAKRNEVAKHYEKAIKALYRGLGEPTSRL